MSTKTKKLRMDEYSPDKKQSHGSDKRRELDNVIKKARRDNDASQNLFWNKKLLEAEEKEPNRWRHTGFKELYIDDNNASKTKLSDDDRTSVGKQKKSENSRSRHESLWSPVNDGRRTYSSSSFNDDTQPHHMSPSPRPRTDKFGSSRHSPLSPREEKSLPRKKQSRTPPANDLHDDDSSSSSVLTSQKQTGRRKKSSPDQSAERTESSRARSSAHRATRTPVRERSSTGKTRSPSARTTRRSLSAPKRDEGSPTRKRRSLSRRTSPLIDRKSSRRKSTTPRGTSTSTGRAVKRGSSPSARRAARSSSRRRSLGSSRRRSPPPPIARGRTSNNRSRKGGSRSRSPLVSRRRTRSPIPPRRRTRSPIPHRRRTRSPIPPRRRTRSPIPPRRRSRSPITAGSYRRLSSRRMSDTRIRSPPTVVRRMKSRTPVHFDRSTPPPRKTTTSRYRAVSSSVNRSSPYRRKSPVSVESSYRKRSVAAVDHPRSSRHYGSPNGSAYGRSKTTAMKSVRRTRSNSPTGYKVDRRQRYNHPSPEASSSSSVCSDPNCNLCLADKEIPKKKTDPTPIQSLISAVASPVAVLPPASTTLLACVGHCGKKARPNNIRKSKKRASSILSKSVSSLPVVMESSPGHGSRTPRKERTEKRASKKKKAKKRDKQQKVKSSEAIASNVIHRKRIKVESVSDEPETTATPKKPTLSERFGKMAHQSKESPSSTSHNRNVHVRRTEKYSIPSPAPPRIEEPDPYVAPLPPPQPASLHSKFTDHSPVILENIWEDVRTRYAYYKERGYLQDLSFQDYIKWEEWWYQSLEEERGLDRLNFPHM